MSKLAVKQKNEMFRLPLNWEKKVEEVGTKLKMVSPSFQRTTYVEGSLTSGSFVADLVTGGGAPRKKFLSIHGPSGSGKSTLTYHFGLNAVRLGIPVLNFDHECAIDSTYLTNIGFNMRSNRFRRLFSYFQPDTGEDTFRFISRLLRDVEPIDDNYPSALVIIDSLAAMVPEAVENNDETHQRALLASLLSEGFRMIKGAVSKAGAALITVNHVRQKPGVSFGNPEYEPGGQSVIFYPDIRLRLGQITPKGGKQLEDEKEKDGRIQKYAYSKLKTPKNKVFPPFQEGMMRLRLGRGIDAFYDVTEYLAMTGQARKSAGKWVLDLKDPSKAVRSVITNGRKLDRTVLRDLAYDYSNESPLRSFIHNQMRTNVGFDLFKMISAGGSDDSPRNGAKIEEDE